MKSVEANPPRMLKDPVFIGTLFVALLLRLLLINKESLWFDEIFSIRLASGSLTSALHAEQTNPPLHFVLLHLWISLFGSTAVATRAMSVIPSLLAIATSYLLAYRLFDRSTARLASLFLCVSSFQIYFAQEVRTFSLLLFLLTLSLLSLERIVFSAESRRDWLLYLVATILALYSHFYATFFVVSHSVIFVLLWRTTKSKFWAWTIAQIFVGLCFIPWLVTMLGAASQGGQQRRHLLLKLPQSFFSFLAGDTLIPLDERAVQSIVPTLTHNLPALLAASCGFGYFFLAAFTQIKVRRPQTVFCLTAVFVPTLIAFAISLKIMLFEERYLIGVTSPLVIVLAASAVHSFGNIRSARISAIAAGLVLSVTALSLNNYYFNPRFGRDEWRESTEYVDRIRQEGDMVLLEPDYISICYEYYTRHPAPIRYLIFDDYEDRTAPHNQQLYAALRIAPRVILVRSNYRDESFLRELLNDFTIEFEKKFEKDKGISVYTLVSNAEYSVGE